MHWLKKKKKKKNAKRAYSGLTPIVFFRYSLIYSGSHPWYLYSHVLFANVVLDFTLYTTAVCSAVSVCMSVCTKQEIDYVDTWLHVWMPKPATVVQSCVRYVQTVHRQEIYSCHWEIDTLCAIDTVLIIYMILRETILYTLVLIRLRWSDCSCKDMDV